MKLVDTRKKGLRASVPKGLPYFSVEFGLDGGFAHVIEDETLFPLYFGKEIIGGMLDLEPQRWRNPRRENFEHHKRKVLQNLSTCSKYLFLEVELMSSYCWHKGFMIAGR